MLLNFSFKNYKTFVDMTHFSMQAAPKQKGLDYSLFEFPLGKKRLKVLSSSVIYGPNASGKTNLIGALDTFRSIVLRGHILNGEQLTDNTAASLLEFIPNTDKKEPEPIYFAIEFIQDHHLFSYELEFLIGHFFEQNYDRQILHESLYMDRTLLFSRDKDNIKLGSGAKLTPLKKSLPIETNLLETFAASTLIKTELFLTNGFKNIYTQELYSQINAFFKEKLRILYHADHLQVTYTGSTPFYEDSLINKVAQAFGVDHAKLCFVQTENNGQKSFVPL